MIYIHFLWPNRRICDWMTNWLKISINLCENSTNFVPKKSWHRNHGTKRWVIYCSKSSVKRSHRFANWKNHWNDAAWISMANFESIFSKRQIIGKEIFENFIRMMIFYRIVDQIPVNDTTTFDTFWFLFFLIFHWPGSVKHSIGSRLIIWRRHNIDRGMIRLTFVRTSEIGINEASA